MKQSRQYLSFFLSFLCVSNIWSDLWENLSENQYTFQIKHSIASYLLSYVGLRPHPPQSIKTIEFNWHNTQFLKYIFLCCNSSKKTLCLKRQESSASSHCYTKEIIVGIEQSLKSITLSGWLEMTCVPWSINWLYQLIEIHWWKSLHRFYIYVKFV